MTKIRIVLLKDEEEIFSGTAEVMKHLSEGNGKTNESRYVVTVQNDEEVLSNNRYLEFFVGMVRAGLKLLMILKLMHFNHLSQEKY